MLIMGLATLVILFDTNIVHLFICLGIVAIDAMSCVVLHNCPLTLLEQKYLGYSLVQMNIASCKKMKILYHCSHEYERTIEILSNVGAMIITKILVLMVVRLKIT